MLFYEVVNWLFPIDSSLEYYISELVNYLFCVCIACFFFKLKLINNYHFFLWLFIFLTPFFFNYFLFDPYYFQDQFGYTALTVEMKQRGIENVANLSFNNLSDLRTYGMDASAALFTYSPIPLLTSVTSIAFTNKLISFLVFVWLYQKTNSNNLIFLFLIPSFILYSSLSLRDPLIIILSIIFLILCISGKKILPLFLLAAISILKIQNGAVLALFYVGRFFFRAHRSIRNLILFALFILIVGFVMQDTIVSTLNFFRLAFYLEDIGTNTILESEKLVIAPSENFIQLIYYTLKELPRFLMMPLIWQASNPFQLIQSLENFLVIGVLILLASKAYKKDKHLALYGLFILIIGLGLYAYVTFNEGTGVRYRFTLLYPFLIYFYYLYRNSKDLYSQKS